MSRLKNFLQGQVEFSVTGLPITHLNKLRSLQVQNISLARDVIKFQVPLVHVAAVKKIINNFDWQQRENHNVWRGLNFLLNHFVLSIAILIGFIAFCVMDLAVYRVEVISPDHTVTQAVYQHLDSMGVKNFAWKAKIAELDLANDLVTSFPNIAHAHVQVKGNTLQINLATASYHTVKTKSNIHAHYDAVIKRVVAFSGEVLVTAGDVVKRGDLLVANAYPDSVVVIGEVAFIRDDQVIRLDIVIV